MLIHKLLRGFVHFFFIVRLIFWKMIYGKHFLFPKFYNSCIETGVSIRNINGHISFKGKFVSRRNLSINVTGGDLTIGKDVFFNQNVSINCHGIITIGDFTIVGEDVKFYDHNHRFGTIELIKDQGFIVKKIAIGKNVWIGSNVIVLSGVSIGDNSIISAGSIVRHNVPSDMILKDGEFIKIHYRR